MIAREQPQTGRVFDRHADVRAALAEPRLGVPPVPPAANGIPWLRGTVSRFSDSDDHPRRRAIADRVVAADPGSLRAAAKTLAETAVGGTAGRRLDVMTLARRVPVATLGAELEVTGPALDELTDCVIAIAAVYPPGVSNPGADEAAAASLERLLALLDAEPDELGANRVGALVQACDATAGLIGNTLNVALREPALRRRFTVDQLVAETIRHDPPVRSTRRQAIEPLVFAGAGLATGEVVVLDFAAANRDPAVFAEPDRFDPSRFVEPGSAPQDLTFGLGGRSCPGRRQATAIAAGVVEAVLGHCSLVEQTIAYEPSPNLRVLAAFHVCVA